jgi:hypothetical protein
MFEIHPSSWTVAVDANDPRDHFHRTALHEARVATDRSAQPVAAAPAGLRTRLQSILPVRRPTATQPCACPA